MMYFLDNYVVRHSLGAQFVCRVIHMILFTRMPVRESNTLWASAVYPRTTSSGWRRAALRTAAERVHTTQRC